MMFSRCLYRLWGINFCSCTVWYKNSYKTITPRLQAPIISKLGHQSLENKNYKLFRLKVVEERNLRTVNDKNYAYGYGKYVCRCSRGTINIGLEAFKLFLITKRNKMPSLRDITVVPFYRRRKRPWEIIRMPTLVVFWSRPPNEMLFYGTR